MYAPEWTFIHNLNIQAVEEIQDSYPGSHIMIYDNDIPDGGLKIYYTESKGLNIFFKSSQIIVNPDSSITIEHKESKSIIELIGDVINIVSTKEINVTADDTVNITATKQVNVKTETAFVDASKQVEVKSDKVIIDHATTIELGKGATEKAVLGNKIMTLFNSHTHIGNMGAPTSPPMKPMTPAELSQKKVVLK